MRCRGLALSVLLLPGCLRASLSGNEDTEGADAPLPTPACEGDPLVAGDASWTQPPFEPPGEGDVAADPDDPPDPSGGCGAFLCEPDGGTANECDVWAQDCPSAEKCQAWANDGGNSWNALKCSPVDPMGGMPGEPCTAVGSGASGIDDCDATAMCWGVDMDTLDGTCVARCTGSEAMPACQPGTQCLISNDGVLNLCLTQCDPVLQTCPPGEVCQPNPGGGGFVCVPDASGGAGFGDPCEYLNACGPGLFCADPTVVPGCRGLGCCSEFCDLIDPEATCMGVGQSCEPWYDANATPDGYEHVGACTIPEDPDPGGSTGAPAEDPGDDFAEAPVIPPEDPLAACPASNDPVVLYMSNDDSNSKASPALARSFIESGLVVPWERVRIHEFLNYFDFVFDNPENLAAKVGIQMRRVDAARGEFNLMLNAQGPRMRPEDRPPMNLVFSLDTSGSMNGEPLALLKASMTALAGSLRAGDTISMVEWSNSQTVLLDGHPVSGPDDPVLLGVVEQLESGGSTDLHGGLVRAYQAAEEHRIEDGINRVVLISDGGANTGVTDTDIIASHAEAADGSEIYLVGVGVGAPSGYSDALMDSVTDAGKGAYIFVNSEAEAYRQFGSGFLANVAVAARDVRLRVTLPWYFGVKSFHGEEYSPNPAEVDPQHLAPNDSMTFHQTIAACHAPAVVDCSVIEARVEYRDPLTGEPHSDEVSMPLGELMKQDADQLRKADAVVGYAKSLIVIDHLMEDGDTAGAVQVAHEMSGWLEETASALGDSEIGEIAALMSTYASKLDG